MKYNLFGVANDFTVIFDDEKLELHKKILAEKSKYFASLFSFDKNATVEIFDKDHLLTTEMFKLFAGHWYCTLEMPTLPLACKQDFKQQVKDAANYLICNVDDTPRVNFQFDYIPKIQIQILNPEHGWLLAKFPRDAEKYYVPQCSRAPHNMVGGIKNATIAFLQALNEHLFDEINDFGEYFIRSFNLEEYTLIIDHPNNTSFLYICKINGEKYHVNCQCGYKKSCTCLTTVLRDVLQKYYTNYKLVH